MPDKVYDLSQLQELAAGSDEFVQSMIQTFLEHTPNQLEEMLKSYRNGDLVSVGTVAHKIKPNIDLFQINEITQDIRTVEEKGKAEINDEALAASLKRVEKILRESFNQMKEG